jgi:hypothetical protein
MARITGPTEMVIPTVAIAGVPLPVPMDLTEGGFLQVIPGPNALGQPIPSVYVPPGCMIAVIPPQVAAHIRVGLTKVAKTHTLAEKPNLGA